MDKRDIRRAARSRIAALTMEQRRLAAAQIFAAVAELPAFRNATTVALFASLHDEPNTEDFITEWSRRKRIVLPRVEGDVMRFYDYSPETMASGSFGINEPHSERLCTPSDIDFMVVPGVAFTSDGRRMGRGKGFYDRYISQEGFRAATVGVCFRTQIVDHLPSEPHGRPTDSVIAF